MSGWRRGKGWAFWGLALAGTAAVAAELPGRELRILARYPVPAAPSPATDVRWASDDAVYLARFKDGVSEVALDGKLSQRRRMVPGEATFTRYHGYQHLAVTRGALVFASGDHTIGWRPLATDPAGLVRFDWWEGHDNEDIDAAGDRLALLGFPDTTDPAKEGALVWLGSLEKHLEDLHPILMESAAPGVHPLYRCVGMEIGAVRFLEDGSLFVVPGVQPGAHLFSADGKLLRSWDARDLGLDTDCRDIPEEQEKQRFRGHPDERLAWVNEHRSLDDVVSLPQGPGLIVRSRVGGKVHWQLRVLATQGVTTYEIPVASDHAFDRIRADSRKGKLVLLISPHNSYLSGGAKSPGELVVAELP
jgi:hypothetical protein